MTNPVQNPETSRTVPADLKHDQAVASSAGNRINIPLNLEHWKDLKPEVAGDLLWLHQHILDEELSWTAAEEALGYDKSTIFRILKGTYTGNWENICKEIRTYRKVATERAGIQKNDFVENSISRLIFSGLDYALASNSITQIIGESRQGKTMAVTEWARRNNHGRSVLVSTPGYGGNKMLLRRIAEAVGVNQRMGTADMFDAVCRAFNRNRILIVDEAHRLIPPDYRSAPVGLEMLRDLHDTTKCGLALIGTKRFDDALRKAGVRYMFEQYLGRIGMPIRLPNRIKASDVQDIVRQYIAKPSEGLIDKATVIANALGRLGILVELLRMASQIAKKAKSPVMEEHFDKALAVRKQMMGEAQED